ncbi:macro domain-containing protein [Wenzhouxiangella sp. EGI_FJ10409]|uniref:macro domain-containing protein n=1 Tax=Wenzhouxiangella sp. EGI_FJ10409 TaxID=3243767 RepID=UPI0035DB56C0
MPIEFVEGDIARQPDLDAVVNAANAELMPGGGVAGALHRAAGPKLADACRPLAPIEPGQAVVTEAFDLPNRWVIHVLGPRYGIDNPSDELLATGYRNVLRLAEEKGIQSLGSPALSAGAFGYPLEEAARIAVQTVRDHLPSTLRFRFVLFDAGTKDVFSRLVT